MKSKKTPGPWVIWQGEFVIWKGENGNEIFSVADCAVNENGKANAAYIVEACNNYERVKADRDELARALQDLMNVLDDRPLDIVAQSETWDRARDALTKSQGLDTKSR